MHSGNMGLSQGLEQVIASFICLAKDQPIQLAMIGDGTPKVTLIQHVQASRAEARIQFLDYQPRTELSTSLSSADVQIVSVGSRVGGCIAPSKLYGELAVGKPVLAVVDRESEVAKLIHDHLIGWIRSTNDSSTFRQQLIGIAQSPTGELERMGQRARELCLQRFDKPTSCRAIENLIQSVLPSAIVPSPQSTA